MLTRPDFDVSPPLTLFGDIFRFTHHTTLIFSPSKSLRLNGPFRYPHHDVSTEKKFLCRYEKKVFEFFSDFFQNFEIFFRFFQFFAEKQKEIFFESFFSDRHKFFFFGRKVMMWVSKRCVQPQRFG